MKTSLFDYHLPPEQIAQSPVEPRDSSRLLVLHRATGEIEHRRFYEIGDYLQPDDLLVANNSRVIPARLLARKSTGGKAEVFLLTPASVVTPGAASESPSSDVADRDLAAIRWKCLVRGRNLRTGTSLTILPQSPGKPTEEESQNRQAAAPSSTAESEPTAHDPILAHLVDEEADGVRIVEFSRPVAEFIRQAGQIPLPPYITEYAGDPEKYQTVFNRHIGSVAAPTAGLHFTPDLLIDLRRRGVRFDTVTLHVGLDTFRPVESEDPAQHPIHSEWAQLTADTAQAINQTTLAGKRVVAVGTTAVRTLEWAAHVGRDDVFILAENACPWQRVSAFAGSVDLFIRPGYRFRGLDCLITNFHLPKSTLLMLVSAFAAQLEQPQDSGEIDHDKGRRMILAAYQEAIDKGYRFFSFGDAMLIL